MLNVKLFGILINVNFCLGIRIVLEDVWIIGLGSLILFVNVILLESIVVFVGMLIDCIEVFIVFN